MRLPGAKRILRSGRQLAAWVAAMFCVGQASAADSEAAVDSQVDDRPSSIAPDIREDETELKLQRGNFVAVPIPISNPTLDTGLVAGAAWFYGQTAEQAAQQPASVTMAAGLYTNNDSRALVIGQQNYWRNNRWRFTGAAGAADLRLSLPVPDELGLDETTDWKIDGAFLFGKLARKIGGSWYGGLQIRAIDADQSFAVAEEEEQGRSADFDFDTSIQSAGLGALVEYDSRDMPINSYSGRYFIVDVLLNDEAFGSNYTYQSYSAAWRTYHEAREGLVLAFELRACTREGRAPLWDACTIGLRGFSATDYLGKQSVSTQLEARWQMTPRWGAVGFAGVGYSGRTLIEEDEHDAVPSYGLGVRFMVLPAKRVNLRVDYARSEDSDAIHVSVGEAF